MGKAPRIAIRDPYEIVQQHARGYLPKGKYPQVVVFTKYVTELDHLKTTFGGRSYTHGSGFVWILATRKGIAELLIKMKPHLPSRCGFENVVDVNPNQG